MTAGSDEWEAIKEITASALELPRAEREAFLRERCGSSETLYATVNELVSSEDDTGDVLLAELDVVVGVSPLPTATAMTEFDGFQIQRLIARGGTSDVYLAHQRHPERAVAIKVFRAGLGSDRQAERFRGEVKILARLDHPNIAAIFSAGFTDKVAPVALPYLAMEYVEGQSLTDYARQRSLTLRDRLALMAKVCSGVHGAHQRGVIHRDLKPANILVREDGEPKVLDFGIARLIAVDGSSSRSHTMTGELLGTLAYMSPEQLRTDHDGIDTRTDVYALGLVLYELLAGHPAFDVANLPIHETIQRIQRGLRISLREEGVDCDPDVEAVLHKATSVVPAERYASVEAFAEDLRRLLSNEPVIARAPTTVYRLRKFAARNKAMVVSGVLVTLLTLTLTAASIVGFVRASQERNTARLAQGQAEAALAREEAVGGYIESMLKSADPLVHGPDVKVVDVLRLWGDDIDASFAANPAARSRLHTLLADTYYALGLYRDALGHYESADAITLDTTDAEQRQELEIITGLINSHMFLDNMETAGTLLRDAMHETLAEHGPTHALSMHLREAEAEYHRLQGDLDAAIEKFESVAVDAESEFGEGSELHLGALSGMSRTYLEGYRANEAIEVLERLVELRTKHSGPEHPGTLIARGNLGIAYEDVGRFEDSIRILTECIEIGERKLGALHHSVRSARGALSISLYGIGRHEDGIELAERALSDDIIVYGPKHADVATSMSNLISMLLMQERYEEAVVYTEEAHTIFRDSLGESHPRTLTALGNHGTVLQGMGRLDEASDVLLKLHAQMELTLGAHSTQTMIWGNNLAMLWHEKKEFRLGADLLARTIDSARASGEVPDHYIAVFERNLGRCLMGAGDFAEAERHLLVSMQLLADAPEHMRARTQEFLDELASLRAPPG